MIRFKKINPYGNFGNWLFAILNDDFETLFIFISARNCVMLETTHSEKKIVKKTKTTINTLKYIED